MQTGPKVREEERGADPRLLAFVDRLSEPLERTLSEQELASYRLQALGHLEMLARELQEDGLSASESVQRALREYGQADVIAISYLDEWCKGTRPVLFARGARSATLWVFVWFGLASAVCLIAVQVVAMLPGMGTLSWAVDALPWVLPVIAGLLSGVTVPTGNLRSVCLALVGLAAFSIMVGVTMMPFEQGLGLARLQFLVWPPIGCSATYMTALFKRRPKISRHTIGLA